MFLIISITFKELLLISVILLLDLLNKKILNHMHCCHF